MKKEVFQRSGWMSLRGAVFPLLFTAGILVIIIIGLNETERSSRAEGKRILEESLWRAAVTCYAIEGRYPPSIAHMEQNYGVHVDRSRFAIHYNALMNNMMPEIVVFEIIRDGG
ncbi:MAG: hypothetical protein FWE91_09025 [Defluviitaleaceae bacterium]|nr:hypothetical protein [Defluviitaleaceae bacterium]MCL2837194.1 hypothetical protein [Defluviitaleaceae bacterium]